MSFSGNKELAENKLILLYMIEKLNMHISNAQLTQIVLEKKLMNYFILQQLIDELRDSNFLSSIQIEGKESYNITDTGKQTLSYFKNLIPTGIKGTIDNTIFEIKGKIKSENLISADFFEDKDNEFSVKLKISEETFSLIDLSLTVGTKNDAKNICNNWKDYSEQIYMEIIEVVTKKRD